MLITSVNPKHANLNKFSNFIAFHIFSTSHLYTASWLNFGLFTSTFAYFGGVTSTVCE